MIIQLDSKQGFLYEVEFTDINDFFIILSDFDGNKMNTYNYKDINTNFLFDDELIAKEFAVKNSWQGAFILPYPINTIDISSSNYVQEQLSSKSGQFIIVMPKKFKKVKN